MKISQAITASSIAIMAITPMIRQTFQVYLALLICGCQGNPPPKAGLPTQKNQPITLRVAAATDLQPWLGETISEWGTNQVPSINVQTIYGSSGQLAAQIRAGAPVDRFCLFLYVSSISQFYHSIQECIIAILIHIVLVIH
jgi:ABC-type molybdate transport system substrate-binding protein